MSAVACLFIRKQEEKPPVDKDGPDVFEHHRGGGAVLLLTFSPVRRLRKMPEVPSPA